MNSFGIQKIPRHVTNVVHPNIQQQIAKKESWLIHSVKSEDNLTIFIQNTKFRITENFLKQITTTIETILTKKQITKKLKFKLHLKQFLNLSKMNLTTNLLLSMINSQKLAIELNCQKSKQALPKHLPLIRHLNIKHQINPKQWIYNTLQCQNNQKNLILKKKMKKSTRKEIGRAHV